MKFLGIIPARYGSTRLEGKPLIDLEGKPMIRHVYENAVRSLEDVYVATDDIRILQTVEDFGGHAVLTSDQHPTGTNRCLEAYKKILKENNVAYDVIINIQGDEPLLHPQQIQTLKNCFTHEYIMMATLATPVKYPVDLDNESEVFVVWDKHFNALYFSRSVIPYLKGIPKKSWLEKNTFYKHVGLYGYTADALEIYTNLAPSSLELSEGLEQNRWIENGYSIKIGLTDHVSMCVDTPEDLERIRTFLKKNNNL
ncbi:MAG: 3-deoxy-manno-octulosonate cytidylyltransferase [Cyclobacteriaceae bacterium]|nr:3-deoxy-manno-octulosonate cytidylyltransferase [Cyclobacteriaceae bacterium]